MPTLRRASPALLALLLGAGLYWVARPAWASHLPGSAHGLWSLALPGWLPSLLHAFAFALLLALAAFPHRRWMVGGCLGWLALSLAFEVGQHARVALRLRDLPEPLSGYFLRGTFDVADLGATVAGVALAWVWARAWLRSRLQDGLRRERGEG
jgi:hypothetical protein